MTERTQVHHVRLDDLIVGVRAAHDDPLEQLAGAMVTAEHLGDVADHLIGHFVDQARRAGASWTDIGVAMGVSKQAAQKRFVTRTPADAAPTPLADEAHPFARFTPRARNVIAEAHNLAAAERSTAVTPEHLARALTVAPESIADLALRAHGVSLDTLAAACLPDQRATPGSPPLPDEKTIVPYNDRSRAVLQATLTAAVELGHDFVGTEHILLGLFEDSAVTATLSELGVEPAAARARVVGSLADVGH
ncbi:ATP-dependent Clp protease ATP-binding subunit [Gordonia sp. HNM0687]|uniref:ATP-dependent Clp protease ATP-binding subunit n=1 Tax=Gordonia mangrovi TaxID=2665643 RepID=A0A6L7GRH9_9ACTN|nr:Clp protease N-terminal domain-containing protein [Gordonia mangrovi]MXP21987.1 ATP-dependent Clp protease ATP-binding subunit [Gordonia mangrovi]UVF76344.1 ATP-dependent Clp protease ATP-binding subunit [Gordonia mangrovi]